MKSSGEIQLIAAKHGYPKRDLPPLLRGVDDWLPVVGTGVFVWLLLSHPGWLFQGLLVVAAIAMGVKLGKQVWEKGARKMPTANNLENSMIQPASRLVCYGDPSKLAAVNEHNVEAFEPVIARVEPVQRQLPLSTPLSRCFSWQGVIAPSLVIVLWVLGVPLLWAFGISIPVLVVVPRVRRLLFQTYYRVTPQTLDVQECWCWSTKTRQDRKINLAAARVVCRYDRQELTIEDPGEHTELVRIDLSTLAYPHAFAEAIFRAARSPRLSAPLPEDELLG